MGFAMRWVRTEGSIVDLVPELQLIIGEPPPVLDLSLQDAQRRFQMVFSNTY